MESNASETDKTLDPIVAALRALTDVAIELLNSPGCDSPNAGRQVDELRYLQARYEILDDFRKGRDR